MGHVRTCCPLLTRYLRIHMTHAHAHPTIHHPRTHARTHIAGSLAAQAAEGEARAGTAKPAVVHLDAYLRDAGIQRPRRNRGAAVAVRAAGALKRRGAGAALSVGLSAAGCAAGLEAGSPA